MPEEASICTIYVVAPALFTYLKNVLSSYPVIFQDPEIFDCGYVPICVYTVVENE